MFDLLFSHPLWRTSFIIYNFVYFFQIIAIKKTFHTAVRKVFNIFDQFFIYLHTKLTSSCFARE
jgi:hypothetical protein